MQYLFILIVLKVNVKVCKGSVLLTHKNTFMWLIKWIMCPWWMYEARKLIFHLILFCNQQISKRILSRNLFSTRKSCAYVTIVVVVVVVINKLLWILKIFLWLLVACRFKGLPRWDWYHLIWYINFKRLLVFKRLMSLLHPECFKLKI
jgi:hypothetical protein